MTEFHQIPLINIIVPESRRKVDPDAVKELAASIMKFGLRRAITVRKVVRQGVYWDTTLVAGLHRLEAVRLLEHRRIREPRRRSRPTTPTSAYREISDRIFTGPS